MPYTIGQVKAIDGDQIQQSMATAQGDGTINNPFVPASADIGIGAIDEPEATSDTGQFTLIGLFKRLLNSKLTIIIQQLSQIAGATPINYSSIAAATSDNVVDTAATLISIEALNLSANTRYLQLYDSDEPLGTPIRVYPVYRDGGLLVIGKAEWPLGLEFNNGITWAMSVTPTLYTPASPNETIFSCQYG